MLNYNRNRLIIAGKKINGGYPKFIALRKLFVSEKRDWKQAGAPQTGWKRGELVEVVQAIGTPDFSEEWGDIGYYIAQSYDILWLIYNAITPDAVIDSAVHKFEKRVERR